MKKRIMIQDWESAPVYWRNLLTSLRPILASLPDRPARVEYVNELLKSYHAIYDDDTSVDGIRLLTFEDDSYHNWFMLRWF